MSITISTPDKICHSPHNSSKSKMLYSFSKASRFAKTQNNPCDKYYEIVSVGRNIRATGFGYDKKYDFTKDLPKSPPPNSYNINNIFDDSKNKKRGYGFGGGRTEMENTGPLAILMSNKNPGPGAYEIPNCKSKTSYSLRGKTAYESKEKSRVPGPGAYFIKSNLTENNGNCTYKFKNHSGLQFSKSSDRFNNNFNKVPGPGAYNTQNLSMSASGTYFFSKIHNSKARKFTMATRKTLSIKSLTPGPGNYQIPSQFGHYMGKQAFHKSKLQQNKQNITK